MKTLAKILHGIPLFLALTVDAARDIVFPRALPPSGFMHTTTANLAPPCPIAFRQKKINWE